MWSTLIFHVLLLSAGFGGDSIAYGQNVNICLVDSLWVNLANFFCVSIGSQPLCANFSKGKDVELNFRAALSFKRTLYFLTDDWEVYEIRGYREQLNRTRKVQLDGKSVPIELKWPSLAKHFAKFRDGPVSVFSTDFDIPIIYIDRKKVSKVFQWPYITFHNASPRNVLPLIHLLAHSGFNSFWISTGTKTMSLSPVISTTNTYIVSPEMRIRCWRFRIGSLWKASRWS